MLQERGEVDTQRQQNHPSEDHESTVSNTLLDGGEVTTSSQTTAGEVDGRTTAVSTVISQAVSVAKSEDDLLIRSDGDGTIQVGVRSSQRTSELDRSDTVLLSAANIGNVAVSALFSVLADTIGAASSAVVDEVIVNNNFTSAVIDPTCTIMISYMLCKASRKIVVWSKLKV